MIDRIIQILGFLGAMGDYSYIDRIGNTIDEIALEETIRDAIRAYYVVCLGKTRESCIEYEKGVGVTCLDIPSSDLENEISRLLAKLAKSTRIDVIKLAREIALKAYAAIPRIREEKKCVRGGG